MSRRAISVLRWEGAIYAPARQCEKETVDGFSSLTTVYVLDLYLASTEYPNMIRNHNEF